jgi:hypothetical protein
MSTSLLLGLRYAGAGTTDGTPSAPAEASGEHGSAVDGR